MSDDAAALLNGTGPVTGGSEPDRPPVVLGAPARPGRVVQRIAAYGVARGALGDVLLVRASDRSDVAGAWSLPGGGLRHGEHPREAVVREVREETGLDVAVHALLDVVDDVVDLPHAGLSVHTVRVLYELRAGEDDAWGTPRAEADGSSDEARFVAGDDLAELPLLPFAARLLLGEAAASTLPHPPVTPPRRPIVPDDADHAPGGPGLALLPRPTPSAAPAEIDAAAGEPMPLRPPKIQRPAAYALVVRPAGSGAEVLLTRLRHTEGLWTLPGGGIEPGESTLAAVRREVYEETGQRLQPDLELLDVDSRTFAGYGPDGRLEDFHGVRVVYRGQVAPGAPPRVVEVGGSTDAAAWIDADALARLPLTSLAQRTLRRSPELAAAARRGAGGAR